MHFCKYGSGSQVIYQGGWRSAFRALFEATLRLCNIKDSAGANWPLLMSSSRSRLQKIGTDVEMMLVLCRLVSLLVMRSATKYRVPVPSNP